MFNACFLWLIHDAMLSHDPSPAPEGKFVRLHQTPSSIDSYGHMEVDLLCEDARIAVELDGQQHLDGVEAYRRDRRDRRKDSLLQENGYLVLRFFAEDVTRRLDEVAGNPSRRGASEPPAACRATSKTFQDSLNAT
jgi:hypothetical protein